MPDSPLPYMERTRRYYEAQCFEKPYVWAEYKDVPFTSLTKPLADSTVTLMTTASLYDRAATDPREVACGLMAQRPERLYANDLSWDKQATHLEDLNSYFPIDHLTGFVADGRIGRVAQRFHCVPTGYSQRRTLEQDAPEILRGCREDAVDVALLVPL